MNWKKGIEAETQQKFLELEKLNLSKSGVTYEFKIEIGFITDRIGDYALKNDLVFVVMDKTANAGSIELLDELLKFMRVPLMLCP